MLLAAVNLLRTKPRLAAYRERPELGPGAALLLRRLVSGEVLLVAGAIFAAALLSSLPPPAKALATLGKASAHVGPGKVVSVVRTEGYTLTFSVDPNKAAVPNAFAVRIAKKSLGSFRVDRKLRRLSIHIPTGRKTLKLKLTLRSAGLHTTVAVAVRRR